MILVQQASVITLIHSFIWGLAAALLFPRVSLRRPSAAPRDVSDYEALCRMVLAFYVLGPSRGRVRPQRDGLGTLNMDLDERPASSSER